MDHFQVVDFSTLSAEIQSLIKDAFEVRKRAYCPYSNFAVGAAIVTEEDSRVFAGCNIESAAFSPTICAERAALSRAVSEGYVRFKAVAVVAHQNQFTAPCGVCRQTLNEFRSSNGETDVYLCRPTMDKVLCTNISQLLPLSFANYTMDNLRTQRAL
ncbi:unnamed protein product [Chilo suppressalis]|uniref:Cytidine deaminase n=1 Tax=Chilo suppressalis TaxID=168631 RepID=A0ABN8AZ85_CHISP|nr:hypothetical protein evm_015143 [Chilo suppressalis]RVE45490.1 hypothetical protein evm_009829 [Chilo suppressalis]CAH0400988.1 unnamed protein product [Chilo suppressalis]